MVRYQRLFEAVKGKQIIALSRYLQSAYNMNFIVIGGGARAIQDGDTTKDLDIVVLNPGKLVKEAEVDPDLEIVYQSGNKPLKIKVKGIPIDLLYPGQVYRKNGKKIFDIPSSLDYDVIKGIKVINKEELDRMVKG